MTNDKYKKIYLEYRDKESFISNTMLKYPDIKYSSALRRWYDFCKVRTYDIEEKTPVSFSKMIIFKDLKKYKKNLTKNDLLKYHFTKFEINWLEENLYLI